MSKTALITIAIISLLAACAPTATLPPSTPAPPSPPPSNPLPDDLAAQLVTSLDPNTGWAYQTALLATTPYGERFDIGTFCRLFRRADGNGYDVLYGGAFRSRDIEESRRYEGDVRRRLSNDLAFQGEAVLFTPYGGDAAFDTDGRFYYTLNAHPQGWRLGKYDLDFNRVQEVIVPLPPGHAANDQMLRVWDERLYLGGLYNPNYESRQPGQQASPDEVLYTHLWLYDTDLNPVADYVLDGAANINGGTLIPDGDGWAYIAADNFVRNNLYAHLYDGNGVYERSILLEENAQWSMGGAVDGEGNIYIAYHRGQHGHGDVVVNVYDRDWNSLARIPVTAVAAASNAQRPWVQVYGDTMFVSYDLDGGGQGLSDVRCLISVYRRNP